MTTHSFLQYGQLARTICNVSLPLEVQKSARGFYIGTANDEGPVSRESVEYWRTLQDAESALANGSWTQKTNP